MIGVTRNLQTTLHVTQTSGHTHNTGDVTGLQTTIDGKTSSSVYSGSLPAKRRTWSCKRSYGRLVCGGAHLDHRCPTTRSRARAMVGLTLQVPELSLCGRVKTCMSL